MSGERLPLGRRGSADRRVAERLAVCEAIVEVHLAALRAELDGGWIGHEHSPLGPERHKRAVRRRVAEGRGDQGEIVGGRFMLTIDAMADEYFGSREPALARALAALARVAACNDNAAGVSL